MTRAIARGLGTMFRHGRLAMVLWAWSLVVGAAGAAPAIRSFRQAWSSRPAADTMLDGLDLPTLVELSNYDVSPTWALAMSAVSAAMMLAFVGGAFMTAGAMHVLLDHDASERTRTLWSRFGRGGGQAFWRSLGVSLITVCATGLTAALAFWAVWAVVHRLGEWPSEAAAWTSMLAPFVPVALVVAVLSATADYARLRVVADPVCGALRAWVGALSFTLRHPLSTITIWGAFAAMTGLVLVASFAWSTTVPTHTRLWLAALVLVQQGVMVARALIRVGVLGAEVAYAEAKGFAAPDVIPDLADAGPVHDDEDAPPEVVQAP